MLELLDDFFPRVFQLLKPANTKFHIGIQNFFVSSFFFFLLLIFVIQKILKIPIRKEDHTKLFNIKLKHNTHYTSSIFCYRNKIQWGKNHHSNITKTKVVFFFIKVLIYCNEENCLIILLLKKQQKTTMTRVYMRHILLKPIKKSVILHLFILSFIFI